MFCQNPSGIWGIRYATCPSKTILLVQEKAEIPFDIHNFKAIFYNKYLPRLAINSISDFIINACTNPEIDSPVFDSIEDLEVHSKEIKPVGELTPKASLVMSWDEIMNRIDNLSFYEEHYKSGTFTPDAIIGISNGGLIMAEIILRKYFGGVPIISLWADRWSSAGLKDPSCHYFTNPFAKAAISPLKLLSKEKEYLTLLLIDDNVSSGTSCQYAVRFLRDELGPNTRIVFQPLVCKLSDYLSVVEEVLAPSYQNDLFKLDKKEFIKQMITDRSRFPYDKDIRG